MAYNKNDLVKKAIEAIEKHKLFFIEDVVTFLPCSKKTFYNYGLHELPELKERLEKNKIEIKVSLRNKWYKSENATLQMALYKLLANEDERRRLSMHYIDHTSDGERVTGFNFIEPDGSKHPGHKKAA